MDIITSRKPLGFLAANITDAGVLKTDKIPRTLEKFITPEKETNFDDTIFETLLSQEAKKRNYKPAEKRSGSQNFYKKRTECIDWLHSIQRRWNCKWQTLLTAVDLVDRYYDACDDLSSPMKLTYATAFFIAAKVEEIYPPKSMGFFRDIGFQLRILIIHEEKMLKTVDWKLCAATPLDFLCAYYKILNYDATSEIVKVTTALVDIFIQEDKYSFEKNSTIAAAAMILGIIYCTENHSDILKVMNKSQCEPQFIFELCFIVNASFSSIMKRRSSRRVFHKHELVLRQLTLLSHESLTRKIAFSFMEFLEVVKQVDIDLEIYE